MALRDASKFIWPAVAQALTQLDLDERDSGAAKLAQRYAQLIDTHADQSWALRWIGPLLLDCLTELGATPAARARLQKAVKQPDAPANRLDQLRKARTAGRRP